MERLPILEIALEEAKKRGLPADEILVPFNDVDPRARNQLVINGHLCEVLPARLLDAEPKDPKPIRLHPSFGWPADFLIYVVSEGSSSPADFYILPASDNASRGAWSVSAKSLEQYKNRWEVLKAIGMRRRRIMKDPNVVTRDKSASRRRRRRPDP